MFCIHSNNGFTTQVFPKTRHGKITIFVDLFYRFADFLQNSFFTEFLCTCKENFTRSQLKYREVGEWQWQAGEQHPVLHVYEPKKKPAKYPPMNHVIRYLSIRLQWFSQLDGIHQQKDAK